MHFVKIELEGVCASILLYPPLFIVRYGARVARGKKSDRGKKKLGR